MVEAESSRATVKSRAYGYVFVGSQGMGMDDPASEWKKDTHYAIHPEEAAVVRRVFENLVHNGKSLNEIAEVHPSPGEKASKRVDPGASSACWARHQFDCRGSRLRAHDVADDACGIVSFHPALNQAWYCSSLTFSSQSTTLPSSCS
jgi:hypothetical protein